MNTEVDPNNFTQKDLMQHLLHAAQHSVTREEMAVQFSQAERIAKERFDQAEQVTKGRFDQIDQRFAQMDQRFELAEKFNKELIGNLATDIKEQRNKQDRLIWAIFAGILALFFKEYIMKSFM